METILKRSHENYFQTIPSDAFGYIHQYLPAESKKAISQVDKQRLQECSVLARSICFTPAKEFSKVDRDTYISLIKRYPNIKKITFQSLCQKTNILDTHHKLGVLLQFLTANKECHPLKHVTEMDIEEIGCPFDRWYQNQMKRELFQSLLTAQNHEFLSAVTHPNLEALTLRLRHNSVGNHTIQSILDKTQLRQFKLDGLTFDTEDEEEETALSFLNHSKLTSLNTFNHISTINSLVNCCDNLEELTFWAITDLGSANHSYGNLKRLTCGLLYSCDDLKFTTKMPKLESLIIGELNTGKEEKLSEPLIVCHSLKELRIKNFNVEEEEHIYSILSGLPNLELIEMGGGYFPDIEKFMEPIKSLCPKINQMILKLSPDELQKDESYQRGLFFSGTHPAPKFLDHYDL